ncbi:DUF4352 domain-containing protein [Streptomyces lonarensis]|uniref:DUF4352 domain-containing protein n=1 Tax=Streptomyces lonarensis TaxID=700599 RepID=A0A7X6D1W8_9ACTN|nr:DUF4352 domain-containing protein [Streptomyces lonarensis]NJQ06699.1 DUF4352 domain-containing protein [Streptomyces lonarensis]
MAQLRTLRGRRLRMVAGVAAAALAVGGLTACDESEMPLDRGQESRETAEPADDADADTDAADDADADEAADDDADDAAEAGAPAEDDGADRDQGDFLRAGQTFVTAEGLEITVEATEAFTPADYVDHEENPTKFGVSVTNGADEDHDVALLYTVRAGERGEEADRIFDSASLKSDPRGTLKPGRTAGGEVGFDVPADAEFIDVTVQLVGSQDRAHWSLDL